MLVSMWMTRDVVTIDIGASLADAATLMARKSIRRLPVVEQQPAGPRLAGIISATDILKAFPPHVNPFAIMVPRSQQPHTTLAEKMNRHPHTTSPDAPIEDAARVMRDQRIGALPVVRGEMLLGLITESDIFRAFVEIFESPKGGVRITFDMSK